MKNRLFNFLLYTMLSALCSLPFSKAEAQQGVGINASGAAADNSAMLDVSSSSKGLLIPRVALTQTTSASPVTSPAVSLLVYNTATMNDVTPGYYYWNGSKWVPIIGSSGAANAWLLTGNAGTTAGTNYFGTTDATDLWITTANALNPPAFYIQGNNWPKNFGLNTTIQWSAAGGGSTLLNIEARSSPGVAAISLVSQNSHIAQTPNTWIDFMEAANGSGIGNNPIAQIINYIDGTNATDVGGNLALNTRPDGGSLTERMRITGAGNVGIGTANPAYPVDVVGDINTSTGYRLAGTGASGNYLRGNGTDFVSSAIQPGDLPAGSGNYIQNQTASAQTAGFNIAKNLTGTTPVAVITNSTGTPDADNFTLKVTGGQANTTEGQSSSYALYITNGSTEGVGKSYGVYVNTGTSTEGPNPYNYAAYFGGNVGIGNSSPSSLLTVGASNQFQVNSSGNLTKINNVGYSWPTTQGGASYILLNDGSGNLSWSRPAPQDVNQTRYSIAGNAICPNCWEAVNQVGGFEFIPLVNGKITRLGSYHSGTDGAAASVYLWNSSGTQLASVTLQSPGGAAWAYINIGSGGISVTAGTIYYVGICIPNANPGGWGNKGTGVSYGNYGYINFIATAYSTGSCAFPTNTDTSTGIDYGCADFTFVPN